MSDKHNVKIEKHRICDEKGNLGYTHIMRLDGAEPIIKAICAQSLENCVIPIDSIVYNYVLSENNSLSWNIEKLQNTADAATLLAILDAYFKIASND